MSANVSRGLNISHNLCAAYPAEIDHMGAVPTANMGTVPAAHSHSESRLRLRTRRLEKLRCTFAQMLRCRGRSRPRQRF